MWILICASIAAVGLIINSFVIAFEKKKIYEEGFFEFFTSLVVQLILSTIVIVASVYLTISLEEVNAIRDSTSNSAEFWRSVFKGIFYVAALFAVWYAYLKQSSSRGGD